MRRLALERLDHLVLTVRDLPATCRFYQEVLGMDVVTFGAGRVALRFGRQKINLHPLPNDITLVAARPTPGSADLCFLTEVPVDDWVGHLDACGVPLVEGPGRRSGAEGPIQSIYFRDPDANLLEVSNAVERGDELAPIRAWLREFQACVGAVDVERAKALCDPDLMAFGTAAAVQRGVDGVVEQWRRVWPTIRQFTIRVDEALGEVLGDRAWVAALWDSQGVRPDGSSFPQPGRLSLVLARRDGRWLATHAHFSLTPNA